MTTRQRERERRLCVVRRAWWHDKAANRWQHFQHWKAAGDRAHFWKRRHLARGEVKAAKVNEEQIAKLGPLVHKWEGKWREADHEVRRYSKRIDELTPKPPPVPSGEGWHVPIAAWNPYRRKVANWIVREIVAAKSRGARGVVNSGLRTYSEQKYLWELFKYHGGNVAAYPGTSNHEGYVYPRGAVDWSDPQSLHGHLPPGHKLKWAESVGFADWPHFSGTGH